MLNTGGLHFLSLSRIMTGLEALLLNGETSPSVHSAEKHNEVEKREFTHHA